MDIKDRVAPGADPHTLAATHSPAWLAPFWDAFGAPGIIALAYTLACRHGHDLRRELGHMPFLLIVGKPGSGKSALLQALATVAGKPWGFLDFSRCTLSGFRRALGTDASLQRVPIVADANDDRADFLKAFYNQNAVPALSGREAAIVELPAPGGVILSCTQESDVPVPLLERCAVVRLSHALPTYGHLTPWPEVFTVLDILGSSDSSDRRLTQSRINWRRSDASAATVAMFVDWFCQHARLPDALTQAVRDYFFIKH